MELRAETIIADVLEAWPETAMVFLERGMACPGCAMAPFGTLADAARYYGLDLGAFVADLQRAIPHDA